MYNDTNAQIANDKDAKNLDVNKMFGKKPSQDVEE
jgi:hypothetical protein